MASLRIVLRGLLRTPLFTAIAIVSLALGIGANTAIFSLLDQVMLRTLPVKNPQELVYILVLLGNQSGAGDLAGGHGCPGAEIGATNSGQCGCFSPAFPWLPGSTFE